MFLIFVTETFSRTDEGQTRPKYIFNKFGTNIYCFYSIEVWSITSPNFIFDNIPTSLGVYHKIRKEGRKDGRKDGRKEGTKKQDRGRRKVFRNF